MTAPQGDLISPCDELLFRQIHPLKMRDGVPSKSNFVPEDKRTLSTRREEIGAEGAHNAHISIPLESSGTWAITSAEADAAAELPAYDDENIDGNPPFHVSVWFPADVTRGQLERIARLLHGLAAKRGTDGWLFKAPDSAA